MIQNDSSIVDMNPATVDISEILPDDFDRTGMCRGDGYWLFEKRAIAHLISHGWKFPKGVMEREEDGRTVRYVSYGEFVTTDGDSFGPLVRVLFGAVKPDGVVVDIYHG